MRTFGFLTCLVAVFTTRVEGELARKLSYEVIAGYETASDVTSHGLIDLDQADMETQLKTFDFEAAQKIYSVGGNSGATAQITIPATSAEAAKGATVKQGGAAVGVMKSTAAAGLTSIKVTYKSVCKDGGLAEKDLSGCFTVGGGPISIGDVDVGAPTAVSNSYRTLAGFSTAAESKMTGQEFYEVYKAYYKEGDYANQRVLDGLGKKGICAACDNDARVQIVKKTTAYMNVWMYVIREMEDAIMDCTSGCIKCNDDPVHAWDEAVAFYAGSLEGAVGDTSGKLLHELADKRCQNFGTCSGTSGGSAVNAAIFKEFQNGQHKLQAGKCDEVAPIKKRIVELMSVPLVQGSLRYAYKVDKLQGGSKEFAEGAAFSAAILPRVHACNAAAAKTISDNMNMEASSRMAGGFTPVKEAFESTYACLGITCEDVGGLLLTDTEFYEFAGPCGTSATAPAPTPENAPAPAPAPTASVTAASSTSGSASLQPGAALLLGALLVAHRGILHQVF